MRFSKIPQLQQKAHSRFNAFQELMKHRIRDILLVSSLYDSFVLGEDTGLYELLLSEYMGLNLSHAPGLRRVSSGREAIEMASEGSHFDLIITTLHLEDMNALDYARDLRKKGIDTPIVLLTYDNRELNDLVRNNDVSCFDRVFMWQGNFRVLLAIIKCIEDLQNLKPDTELVGVQSIILIEDSVKFYSSYLPIIYTELMLHSQNVIEEGINVAHKLLRMRARPKIVLCHSYEEAWSFFDKYHDTVLGVISDVEFPRNGELDVNAGTNFAREVKEVHEDIPILLQSNNRDAEQTAHEVGASFLLKNSPRLLHELQTFIKRYFSFGDFVFRLPDGSEVARAHDLRSLEECIHTVPDDSLVYHAERNHFSNWLKARTEFFLAHELRPQKVSDYASTSELRQSLTSDLREYLHAQHRGTIADFVSDSFDPSDGFATIGGGSLGGKGRGLAFVATLMAEANTKGNYEDVEVSVPPTVILKSDVFDEFMDRNDLGGFAIDSEDDEEIRRRFVEAPLPKYAENWLRELLEIVDYPLAVRSSSLLEDSQYQPFAGVYDTFMLPNNHRRIENRLLELVSAVKRVYASTYLSHAKGYIKATPYRLEEEKMAVVIQKLVGQRHGNRFYPDISGVARSHNFYPIEPMKSEDGIVSTALGLGTMVVEGGMTVRFCPKYPRNQVQFSGVDDVIMYTQKEFYALEMPRRNSRADHTSQPRLLKFGLDVAEQDGVLGHVGSTYSHQNNTIYDGISREGLRLVTFAPILKTNVFPLPGILSEILDMCSLGMNGPVEVEFSVNVTGRPGKRGEFRVLQLRPMVIRHEREQLEIGDISREKMICQSCQVLGNGVIEDVRDIVFVDHDRFDRSKTVEVAQEIASLNLELMSDSRPYLLIGIGRWGSADPWLGIPVEWDEIAGAKAIVETGFKDMKVAPSQGTHFFQNLNAFRVGYFTVNEGCDNDFVDWEWLAKVPPLKKLTHASHLRLDQPIAIKMNGHTNRGVILKPGE